MIGDPWDPKRFWGEAADQKQVNMAGLVGEEQTQKLVMASMVFADVALAYVVQPENWPRFRRWVQDGNDLPPPTEKQAAAYSILHHRVVTELDKAKGRSDGRQGT